MTQTTETGKFTKLKFDGTQAPQIRSVYHEIAEEVCSWEEIDEGGSAEHTAVGNAKIAKTQKWIREHARLFVKMMQIVRCEPS